MNVKDDWRFRGLIHMTTDDEVFDRLSAGTVTLYVGFDPTASSLHLGHLFPLCNLRRLQIAGNAPIALAGGGTGLIGDPSYRDVERPLLTREELDANVAGIREQMSRFLDWQGTGQAAQQRRLVNDDRTH